jgi:hypothetical protein
VSERPDDPEETRADFTPDRVPALRIGAWVAGLGLVLLLTLVGLNQLFQLMAEREVYDKELRPVSAALVRQRDRDEASLGRYEIADEKRGRYHVPITRAMELLVAEPARLAPTSAPAPASAPASAAAAAPGAGK